jgi:hypothetical protein
MIICFSDCFGNGFCFVGFVGCVFRAEVIR